MNQSLINLNSNLDDIKELLELSLTLTSNEQKKVIFRSVVVLMIASWEQYIEQLAESSIKVLTNRLRDSSTLPENVKQSTALFSISEKRHNQQEFSDSVWLFAGKGWKNAYINYCNSLTSKLHSASANNVQDLYWKILGIRNITEQWGFQNISPNQSINKLNDMVELRHDIAHGANARGSEVTQENIQEFVEFISKIANSTFQTIFNCTAELSQSQALKYSLANKCYSEIILFASRKIDGVLTLDEIKNLGSSAQGNHNKLCYYPWSLLEYIDRYTRHIPERLFLFKKDEITLPMEILVFDNEESIAKPGTRNVVFSELQ